MRDDPITYAAAGDGTILVPTQRDTSGKLHKNHKFLRYTSTQIALSADSCKKTCSM